MGDPLLDLSAVLLLFGGFLLLSLLRRVPVLTASRMRLKTLFGTTSARWEDLGAFTTSVAYRRGGKVFLKATAPFAGSSTGTKRQRKTFSIPDAFDTPLTTILSDIAMNFAAAESCAKPPIVEAAPPADLPCGAPGFRWPWLTGSLLAAFVVAYVIEQRFSVTAGAAGLLSHETLIATGGLSRVLVRSGDWYRMLTAAFLHVGMVHLVANGLAFALSGYLLEKLVGRAWMFCIFTVGAVAGSTASLALSAPTTVSVGASGAIMAMLVSLLLISFRLPTSARRISLQIQLGRIVIPAVIPKSVVAAAVIVDYGSHFGGALFGVVAGLFLLRTWPKSSPLPGFRRGAAAFAAALLCVISGYSAAVRYPAYARELAGMIPANMLPKGEVAIRAKANALLAAYPQDPRAHLYAAAAGLDGGDMATAQKEARLTIAMTSADDPLLPPVLPNLARLVLSAALMQEGREPEAKEIAQGLCAAHGETALDIKYVNSLTRGLCGNPGS